jgi:hypothetical protein
MSTSQNISVKYEDLLSEIGTGGLKYHNFRGNLFGA